jgi:crotonobetainyl-CoA:carnitine CoA-transferase CaiB-like acyl-CoA transferase
VVGPVYDVRRIFDDPHVRARGNIAVVPDDELGEIPMPGVVPKLSRTPGRIEHPGPRLGEHNDTVYGEMLGLSRDEIAALAREGVI